MADEAALTTAWLAAAASGFSKTEVKGITEKARPFVKARMLWLSGG